MSRFPRALRPPAGLSEASRQAPGATAWAKAPEVLARQRAGRRLAGAVRVWCSKGAELTVLAFQLWIHLVQSLAFG